MSDKKRNIETKVLKLLELFPVVAIIGPRQCGKTFLSKKLKPDWDYFDLEDIETFERISSGAKFFFKRNPHSLILDEAQCYPEIFNTLRGIIDEKRAYNGRFIITGSSSPELLQKISQSLAGRIGIIQLETYKFNESVESKLSPFYKIFENEDIKYITDNVQKNFSDLNSKMLDFWFYGGFPDIEKFSNAEEKSYWFDNYINTYVNRDIKALFPRINSKRFQRFLIMLLRLSGTIINKREMAQALDVAEPTIKDYIDICDKTFLWRNLNSFEYQIKKEVIKMPKGHIRDSGVLHHALKINDLKELDAHPIVGHSFESFVIEEILKGVEATHATSWSYHYYRTRNRAEIDLVLHGKFGIIPIEIKYGMNTRLRSLKSLISFVNEHNLPYGILINNSEKIDWISDKIIQIPVGFI